MNSQLKVRVRRNNKIQAWESLFDNNWYIISNDKELDENKVFEYKYNVLKYRVLKLMKALNICDFDIYPWASRLKEELNFNKDEHNKIVTKRNREVEYKLAQDELKKQKEQNEIERQSKLLAKQKEVIIKQKVETMPRHNIKPNAEEIKIRWDIINGTSKNTVKKKYKISNADYRSLKTLINNILN